MTITLAVTARGKESRDVLEKENKMPAVVYGPKQEPVSLALDQREFEQVFKEAGESTIIELAGLEEPLEVLIHEIEFHPTKPKMVHVDFYAFERGKEMTTEIPLTYVGTAPIEKGGGMVNKILHEVTVTCRPSDLPKDLTVDVSEMAEEDAQITIADLTLPEGVKVEHEADEMIAIAQGAREEEEEPEVEEVDMDAIEVEEKGKAEEEGEEEKEA